MIPKKPVPDGRARSARRVEPRDILTVDTATDMQQLFTGMIPIGASGFRTAQELQEHGARRSGTRGVLAFSMTGHCPMNHLRFCPGSHEHAAQLIGKRPWEVSRDLIAVTRTRQHITYHHSPVVADRCVSSRRRRMDRCYRCRGIIMLPGALCSAVGEIWIAGTSVRRQAVFRWRKRGG
jgi:hypothetical protein